MTRKEELQKHTSDMLAVESHILEAVRDQLEDDDLNKNIQAKALIQRIETALQQNVNELKSLGEEIDADPSAFKKAITSIAGTLAGMYDKLRVHTVTRMLRDDYTALNLAAAAYTTYHAFGLAINEQRVADLALRHLKALTPLIMEINEMLPETAIQEIAETNESPVDRSAVSRARSNTQNAWQPSN